MLAPRLSVDIATRTGNNLASQILASVFVNHLRNHHLQSGLK